MKTVFFILKILIVSLLIISILITGGLIYYKKNYEQEEIKNDNKNEAEIVELQGGNVEIIEEINDWRLILVNNENPLPENFAVELANFDYARQFDKRAINELITMIKDMKAQGVKNIWVQSAYRSPEYQETLFNNKVKEFINMGKTQEEAEKMASKWVNKSETSEHNVGLAVDFNNVKQDFENTKEFKWLTENAENYGFILRYKKEKENITKVNYEPWHWRYVGAEHAKEINKLDMCLEEYIDYIKTKNIINKKQ